jgi:hypothetical protein
MAFAWLDDFAVRLNQNAVAKIEGFVERRRKPAIPRFPDRSQISSLQNLPPAAEWLAPPPVPLPPW